MGNGQFSSNPWLMEMPDPVARTSWGNYLAVPVSFDGEKRFKGYKGLDDGDYYLFILDGPHIHSKKFTV